MDYTGMMAMLIGLIAVILGSLVFLIPIAGFTIRFALRPWVDRALGVMEARSVTEAALHDIATLDQRIALLEQELHLHARRVDELSERADFHEQLGAGPASPPA